MIIYKLLWFENIPEQTLLFSLFMHLMEMFSLQFAQPSLGASFSDEENNLW